MNYLKTQFKILLILNFVWCFNLYAQHTENQPFVDQVVEDLSNHKNDKPIKRRMVREGVIHLEQGIYHGKEVNGEIVIPIEYTLLQWEYSSYMNASKGGYSGIISSKNEIIVPFIYSSATFNTKHNTVNVCTPKPTKGCGIISLDNKPIVPLVHTDYCKSISLTKHPSIAYACSDDKPVRTIFYDSTGVFLSEHPYQFILNEISENYYAIQGHDYAHGILNSNFELIVPATYTHYDWYFKDHVCMSYFKNGLLYSRIFDLTNGDIKLDMQGSFKKPNEKGIFNREYYDDKKQFIREPLNIYDYIILKD